MREGSVTGHGARRSDGAPAAEGARPLVAPMGLFAGLVALYTVVRATNPVEAYDASTYVMMARTSAFSETFDTRNVLFHKLNRLLWRAAEGLGLGLSAGTVLAAVSVVSGAFAVVLFERWLRRALYLAPQASLLGALGLALSYGFWRYANEIEVYTSSVLLIIATLTVLAPAFTDGRHRLARFFAAGLLGGAGVLFYQANGTVLVLAIPVLFFSRSDRRRQIAPFLAYGAGGTLLAGSGFVLAYLGDEAQPLTLTHLFEFINRRGAEFPVLALGPGALAKAALVVTHDIASLNWLYGIPGVPGLIERIAPSHYYDRSKELFFAAHAYGRGCYIGLATFAALVASALALLPVAWRAPGVVRQDEAKAWLRFILAWIVANSAVNIWLDPGSREVWITMLPALMALLAAHVIDPVVREGKSRLAIALIAILFVHDIAGGFAIVRRPPGDYDAILTEGLSRMARPGDVVLFSEVEKIGLDLARTLNLRIVNLKGADAWIADVDTRKEVRHPASALLGRLAAEGARIFAFGAVLEPRPLGPDQQALYAQRLAIAERLRPKARVVFESPLGATYEIER